MSSPRTTILVVGIAQGGGNPSWDKTKIMNAVEDETKKAAEAGYDLTTYAVDMFNNNTLTELEHVIKSHQFDGVCIGFGLRGNKENTPLFEKVLNLCVHEINLTPKFAFPLLPSQLMEPIERVFGKGGGA